jgi:hypothetical protein
MLNFGLVYCKGVLVSGLDWIGLNQIGGVKCAVGYTDGHACAPPCSGTPEITENGELGRGRGQIVMIIRLMYRFASHCQSWLTWYYALEDTR